MVFRGKRWIAFLLCCICFCSSGVFAADVPQITESTEVIRFDDGSYAEITLTIEESQTRAANTKTASKKYTYQKNGTVYFTYTLNASFQYDNSSSKATRCSSTYSISASGWSKKSENKYYSGNTAHGKATFGNSSTSKTAKLTITCSKTGAIS